MIEKLLRAFQVKAASFPRALPWLLFSASGSRVDYSKQANAQDSSIVMALVNWIARVFPEAPPCLWQYGAEDELEKITQHPMLRLLRRPNGGYSGSSLWMATIYSWVMDGNAYWRKVRPERGGAPVELWYLPHFLVEPKGSDTDGSVFISHYDYKPGLEPIRIETEDIIHFRHGIDPEHTRQGLSPIKSLMREIWTDEEAANYTASMLRNMGIPGAIIAPSGDYLGTVNPDEVEAAKAAFTQRFTGDRRGEPMFFSAPTEVKTFGFSPEQMNARAMRQIPEERAAALLGIPAAVVGFGTGLEQTKVGATLSEQREQAFENNIIPTQRLFAEELKNNLLPEYERNTDRFEVGFDLSTVRVLQDDENAKAERWARLLQSGIASRADARLAMGLPVEDTDHVYLLPLAVVEIPVGEAGPTFGSEPTPALNPGTEGESRSAALFPELKATQAQSRLMRQFRNDQQRLEAAFAADLERLFSALGRLAETVAIQELRAAAVFVPNGQAEYVYKADPPPAEDVELVQLILEAMNLGQFLDERLRPGFEGHYLRVANMTVGTINEVLRLGVDMPDHVQRQIVAQGGKRMGLIDIAADTRRAIFRALAEGRSLGEGPPDLARRIRDNVPAGRFSKSGARYRSTMIARTETKYAQNMSSLAAYGSSDVVDGVIAFDNQTGFNDADCLARDGAVYTLAEAEVETTAEHPNGTLSWAPNIRG